MGGRYCDRPLCVWSVRLCGAIATLCLQRGMMLNETYYGVDIPKNVWHKLESLESGSVIFECEEGPFVPHEIDGILEL